MNTVKTFVAFPIKLAGKLILLALIAALIGIVVGVTGFLFAPTDTPLGHNTTRWELIQAEQKEIAKLPGECAKGYSFTGITKEIEDSFWILALGPGRSLLEFGPIKNTIRPNGSDYKSKNMNFVEQIAFARAVWSHAADLTFWNIAHSGEPTSAFDAPKECQLPQDFVKLQTPRPSISLDSFIKFSSKNQ